MEKNYDDMTIPQLESIAVDLSKRKQALRAEQKKVKLAISAKYAAERVKQKLAAMSPTERAAMKEALTEG